MKIYKYSVLFLILSVTSCITFNANIKDVSENDQVIEVSIQNVTFDSNEPLIERITLNIKNNSNSTIRFIPENCFFRDNNGFHKLTIPPISIRSNDNVNIPIESLDYFETISSSYYWGYGFSTGISKTTMQDLNVGFIEINFSYIYNNIEYIGIYYIDVEKINNYR